MRGLTVLTRPMTSLSERTDRKLPLTNDDEFDDVPPGFNLTKAPSANVDDDDDIPPGFQRQKPRTPCVVSSNESSDDEYDDNEEGDVCDANHYALLTPGKNIGNDLDQGSDFEADEANYEQGQWWYVCVGAKGAPVYMTPDVRTKARKDCPTLSFGEMVWVSERGFVDGVCVLHLGDGRGWVNEISHGKRLMSECFREELDPPETFTAVGKAVLYVSPCYQRPEKSSTLVKPGELILSRERASVLCRGKRGEERMTFYKIDSRSGGPYSRKNGWLVESANGNAVIAPIRIQDVETPEWYLVVHDRGIGLRSGPTISEKARLGSKDTGLPYGEFVCVEQKAFQNEYVFLKLKNGGWVFEAKGEARAMVRVVSELHNWTYTCCDKQGAEIRKAPCRINSQKTGRKVKHRQRLVVTEKARIGDEVFLRCAPPIDGWVTELKKTGERKMRPLHPIPSASQRGTPPQSDASGYGVPMSYPGSINLMEPQSASAMKSPSNRRLYKQTPTSSSFHQAPPSSSYHRPQTTPGSYHNPHAPPSSSYHHPHAPPSSSYHHPARPSSSYHHPAPPSSSYHSPHTHPSSSYHHPHAPPCPHTQPSSSYQHLHAPPSSHYPQASPRAPNLAPPTIGRQAIESPNRCRETPPTSAPRYRELSPQPPSFPQAYPPRHCLPSPYGAPPHGYPRGTPPEYGAPPMHSAPSLAYPPQYGPPPVQYAHPPQSAAYGRPRY
eukprot:GEMP01006176.1.p1 GENE.GEMP01006176.1~~GEMP01006176.1.p1  ORF type:complete len:721 (+),score=130.88 GEMP01006176.1:179-2341(+)